MGNRLRWMVAKVRGVGYRLRRRAAGEDYWDSRAARLGTRADSLISDFAVESAQYREAIAEAIACAPWQPGPSCLAVDWGCGTGRFTDVLASCAGGRAVGVDPSQGMLRHARPTARTSFARIVSGRSPLRSGSVDLLAVIHVLGGLSDGQLAAAVEDTTRILRPGGVLFVAEADEGEHSRHWHGRSAEFYCGLWRFAPLVLHKAVVQGGRRVNLMFGMRG